MATKFAPNEVYVKHVLEPSFNRHRHRFLKPILGIHRAHTLMLGKQKIISLEQTQALLQSLARLDLARYSTRAYDPQFEDLYFMLEHALMEDLGPDVAGNVHIAFSRNDMDATMFRMSLRDDVLGLVSLVLALRGVVTRVAADHSHTVMLAHTHNQQAQPTTLAHYLMAVEQQLNRDTERLLGVLPRLNLSPMGACALAGTGFPIDRDYVAGLLGFNGLVINTYDAVSTADYTAEIVAVLQVLLTGLSRVVCDLMFWVSNEVNALELDRSFVQVSSIMPNKRNPVALEHVRSMLGRALGRAQGVMTAFHNVPYGDINDTADNIQGDVEEILGQTQGALQLLTQILDTARVNTELLRQRSSNSLATATELADMLTRECQLSFRQAHGVVSGFVDGVTQAGTTPAQCYTHYVKA
ncbi:MAG: argininosuccinate lyase, partial [Peptococcaceae bacterium]|nr:argininosuccinate lyase [Peptococcaceae bacterium]